MNYKRALVIRFGGLGDILLATPTIRALHAKFPGIEIDAIVGGGMGDSLIGHPCVRNVIVFDKRGVDARLDRLIPLLGRLAAEHYDLVVNLHPSAKSYLMACATGARRQLRFRKNADRDPRTGHVTHAVDDFLKELKPLGIDDFGGGGLDFIVPDSAFETLDGILRGAGVDANSRLLVINPAASRPINRWPIDRFKQVAAHFADQPDTTVLITGAPSSFRTLVDKLDEGVLARDVAAAHPRIINLAGRLNMKELGALLSRASAFLTCDTGPMHVGVAMGAKMVVLSGAADPNRTGPRGGNAIVIIDQTLPCVPCRARSCARGDVKCMDNINVRSVIRALRDQMMTQSPEKDSYRVDLPVVR